MKNILQVWWNFTSKQTLENGKIFFRKYFTSEQMECQKYENCQTNPILEVNLNWTSNVLI